MTTDSPKIQAIKQRYKDSFPDKVSLIQGYKKIVEEGADIQPVHEGLHKLAGSSGMYGYDDIAFLCRSAMQNLSKDQMNTLTLQLDELVTLLEN